MTSMPASTDTIAELPVRDPIASRVGLRNVVREADTARLDLDQHLTSAWRDHWDILDD